MKALGIVSVVIGHSFDWIIPMTGISAITFVYTYHLMIFFVVAGYCPAIEKRNESAILGHQFIKITLTFGVYNAIFTMLHNHFVKIGLINDVIFDTRTLFACMIRGFFWDPSEKFLAAFRFLKFYFFTLILWLIFVKCIRQINSHRCQMNCKIIYCLICYIIGLVCIDKSLVFHNYGERVFLAIPVLFIGEIAYRKKEYIKKHMHWYMAITAVAIIFIILKITGKSIEIAAGQIIIPVLFYPITFLGIGLCTYISYIIANLNYSNLIRRGMSCVGRNSVHIMALHFWGIKMTDFVYSCFHQIKNTDKITQWPHSSYGLNLSYLLLGVVFPTIIIEGLRRTKDKIKYISVVSF